MAKGRVDRGVLRLAAAAMPNPSCALLAGQGRRELKQRKLEAFDELSHGCEIKSINGVAGEMVVRIPEEGSIRDHERWQTSIPE
jgi:hypothetical protein